MNVSNRFDEKAENFKLNISVIKRAKKIGVKTWGHVWLESKHACIFSELSDDFILNGITFFDGRHIKSIDRAPRKTSITVPSW